MDIVVAGLVSRTRKDSEIEYLFIEYKYFSGIHGLCGGHVDKGENKTDALKREFFEELGVEVKPLKHIHTMPADIKGKTIEIWECLLENYDFHLQEDEIVSAKWFSIPEIINQPEIFFPAIYKYFVNLSVV